MFKKLIIAAKTDNLDPEQLIAKLTPKIDVFILIATLKNPNITHKVLMHALTCLSINDRLGLPSIAENHKATPEVLMQIVNHPKIGMNSLNAIIKNPNINNSVLMHILESPKINQYEFIVLNIANLAIANEEVLSKVIQITQTKNFKHKHLAPRAAG
ncbi:MAG: hypothetical protein ACR2HS_01025 [Gammaproteobacteria bacterium]